MLSLETLGCFPAYDPPLNDPWPAKLLRPLQGKFLALVSNMKSRHLAYTVARTFRGSSDLPVRAIALPGFPAGHTLLRPLVILAMRLSRHDGDRYSAFSLSLLSHAV
jgi:hypothetical protein